LEYLTEEEQVERLRAWWKEYGLAIVAGIVIAILVVVGWRYYDNYKAEKAAAASLMYTTIISSQIDNNLTSAEAAANALIKKYPSSPYASMASLWLAKDDVTNKAYKQAITPLNWVLEHGDLDSLKSVARLRLAQVYLQLNQPKKTLATLELDRGKSVMSGLMDETRGDAYVKLGENKKADQAYEQALVAIPNSDKTRPVLAMKLANLPVSK
jgi:predicted negative regulator of RcsB-dependent stress response